MDKCDECGGTGIVVVTSSPWAPEHGSIEQQECLKCKRGKVAIMTELDLDEIQKSCEEAALGPWKYWLNEETGEEWVFCGPTRVEYGEFGTVLGKYTETLLSPDGLEISEDDWHFIVNARTWVPALVTEVRRLQERLRRCPACGFNKLPEPDPNNDIICLECGFAFDVDELDLYETEDDDGQN